MIKQPFQKIGIDTIGPLRKTPTGKSKIIIIIDYTTKWVIARAVPSERSEEVAALLREEVYLKYGCPEVILSDRGKNFCTELLRDLYAEFNSKHLTISAYHPQTNGLVERFNRTLNATLSMYINRTHQNWDEYLQYAIFGYNCTVQDSTGQSPFYLLHGYHPTLVTDFQNPNTAETLENRLQLLDEARETAIRSQAKAQVLQKTNYDKNRYDKSFEEGDLVLLRWVQGRIGQSNRFRAQYIGPFRVIKRKEDVYYLENLLKMKRRPAIEIAHITRIKKYYDRQN